MQAALTDTVFRMLRQVRTLECGGDSIEALADWRAETGFSSGRERAALGSTGDNVLASVPGPK